MQINPQDLEKIHIITTMVKRIYQKIERKKVRETQVNIIAYNNGSFLPDGFLVINHNLTTNYGTQHSNHTKWQSGQRLRFWHRGLRDLIPVQSPMLKQLVFSIVRRKKSFFSKQNLYSVCFKHINSHFEFNRFGGT